MKKDEIVSRLTVLSEQHKATEDELEDLKDSDSIETEAWDIVYQYCIEMGYKTPETLLTNKPTFDADDLFVEKKWFIDTLVVTYDDVAEIAYHLVSKFWPDEFTSKENYIESVKGYLESPDLFY